MQPGPNVNITVSLLSINSTVAVADDTQLVFTAENWTAAQTMNFAVQRTQQLSASGVLTLSVAVEDPNAPTIVTQLYVCRLEVASLIRVVAVNASQSSVVPSAVGSLGSIAVYVSLDTAVDVDTNATISFGSSAPFEVTASPPTVTFPAGSPAGAFAVVNISVGTVYPQFETAAMMPVSVQATVSQAPAIGAANHGNRVLVLSGLLDVDITSAEDFLQAQPDW